jgi:hypothetical protein
VVQLAQRRGKLCHAHIADVVALQAQIEALQVDDIIERVHHHDRTLVAEQVLFEVE